MLAPVYQTVFQVVHHSFLYANLFPLLGGAGLGVYRSVALNKLDDWYKPVDSFLDKHPHELLFEQTIKDSSMMFGEAQHTVYKLKESLWQK